MLCYYDFDSVIFMDLLIYSIFLIFYLSLFTSIGDFNYTRCNANASISYFNIMEIKDLCNFLLCIKLATGYLLGPSVFPES